MTIERFVFVHGTPAPQGSKRHVGNGRMIESSPKLLPWRTKIADTVVACGWANHPLNDGAVRVVLDFIMPRPKYHFLKSGLRANAPTRHTVTPDIDKLARAVLDALTNAGVWRDDAQVAQIEAYKTYGTEPGVWVRVIALEDDDE